MRYTRWTWLLTAVLLCPAWAAAVDWRTDFGQALDEARERGAPIFILYSQNSCPPAKAMYERVLAGNRDFDAACENAVPILCHMQVDPACHGHGIINYLQQYFFTPTYVYADSRGRPLDEAYTLRTMHTMVKAEDLAAKLAGYSAAAKPLARADWQAARKKLDAAQAAFGQADAAGAAKLLDEFLAADHGPVLTARARFLQRHLRDHEFYLGLKKQIEEDPKTDDDIKACRVAIGQALDGDPITARGYVAAVLGEDKLARYPRAAALAERCAAALADAFEANRTKMTLLALNDPAQAGDPQDFDRPYGAYWQIGVSFGSELPLAGEVTIQYYVLTTDGNVHAGYQTFHNVKANFNHQAAIYLPVHMLARAGVGGTPAALSQPARDQVPFAAIQDVHFEVYAGKRLVAFASQSGRSEPAWWQAAEYRPLVCLEGMRFSWESDTLGEIIKRGLVFGQDAKAAQVDLEPSPALLGEVLVWMYGQGVMTEFGRPEEKHLLALGEPAVGPLARALDPRNQGHALRCASILARLRGKECLAPLAELVKSKEPYVVSVALRALSQYGDDRAVPVAAIVPLLDNPDAQTRRGAAYVLGLARDEKAVPALISRLKKETDEPVRAQLVSGLARAAGQDFGLTADKPLAEQTDAARKLETWWAAHGKEPREAWLAEALNAAGYAVGKPADWPQGRLPDAAEDAVAKAALDRRWPVAYAALRLPPPADAQARVPVLLTALEQAESDEVRQAALLGLSEWADGAVLLRLVEIAKARPAVAGHVIRLLEDLTGMFTLPTANDMAQNLFVWQTWLTVNGPRLHRPPGAHRLVLAAPATQPK